jgi:hypothetical protein
MKIHQEELLHPTQASRVRLSLYELKAPPAPVHGMDALLRTGQFLVTEDRVGTTPVVSTLGSFPTRDEALARLRRRSEELQTQHYRPLPRSA